MIYRYFPSFFFYTRPIFSTDSWRIYLIIKDLASLGVLLFLKAELWHWYSPGGAPTIFLNL
jgi:hypothetical protein